MRIALPQTAEDAEQLREYAAAFVAEKFPAPAGPDPSTVGGAAEYEGAAGEMRGAYGRETAAAYGGWSEAVRDRAGDAGAPRPGSVEVEAMEARVETKTDQIMMGTAREARQTVTGQDAAEGRAGVAAETSKPFERHATESLPVVGDWLAGKLFGTAQNAVPDGVPGGTEEERPPTGREGLGGLVAVSRAAGRSAQVAVVVEDAVLPVPQIGIPAGLRDPVHALVPAVGQLVVAERGPVAAADAAREHAGEAGEDRPQDRRQPRGADGLHAGAGDGRNCGVERGEGEAAEHEGALRGRRSGCVPLRSLRTVNRSRHGHGLRSYRRHGERESPPGPASCARLPALLDLRAASHAGTGRA